MRILSPQELDLIGRGAETKENKNLLLTLLLSGLRYEELVRLQENPEWFKGDVIELPHIKLKERSQLKRTVFLSNVGSQVLEKFLRNAKKLSPLNDMNANLKRWAVLGNLKNPKEISYSTLRHTWEVYLRLTYPKKTSFIMDFLGITKALPKNNLSKFPFESRCISW